MKNNVVLVTGGAGYIGSHACKALAAAGFLPVVYDNMIHGHKWAVNWGPLEVGDLLDKATLDAVFLKYKPSAVMHFAAYAYVGESVSDPLKYYQNNVGGSVSLLQAMAKQGVDKLVFSSTCAVYGHPQQTHMDEAHPQNPINPYGQSKRMVEQILRDAAAGYGLRSIALRYFNAAGADLEGQIGEAHQPESHLIPLMLAATNPENSLTVFGCDYPTPDGSCVRDYIHVSDLAAAHVAALQALLAGAESGAYNLGTGTGISVFEAIESVERIVGKKVHYSVGGRRAGDPAYLVANSDCFKTRFSWQPRHSDISTLIETAWHWFQKSNGGKGL